MATRRIQATSVDVVTRATVACSSPIVRSIAMDVPRIKPSRSRIWTWRALLTAGLVALVVVPVVAMGAWLVIADPVVAADVAAEGDLWPIVRAIVETVRDAFRDLLALI